MRIGGVGKSALSCFDLLRVSVLVCFFFLFFLYTISCSTVMIIIFFLRASFRFGLKMKCLNDYLCY